MDSLLHETKKEKGINKVLLVGMVIGAVIIALAIGLISLRPSYRQIEQLSLEGAFREGSPEFATFTRKIFVWNDEDRTTWSFTGLGTIMMSMGGVIKNSTDKTLNGLELKVSVVDSHNKVIKEKDVIVIPKQIDKLQPGEELPVQVVIEGFKKEDDRANIRWKVTAIKIEQ